MAKGSNNYTIRLSELSRNDIEHVGVKAANLGELMRLGLPVPDGFVLTASAFDNFLTANALEAVSPAEKTASAPVPADLIEALLLTARELGDVPLAVRSSGVAEDLAGASFAGQYETVLDVRGADALIAAVRKCWVSAFSQRVVQYRAAHGQNGVPRMAVLVQRLVQPDAAGVAFTANPVTGDDEVVVSAVKGLGERLVSGQASPDEWLVRENETICRSAPEKAIDAAQAKAVAELARKAEAHFKAPQDIEWAFAGGKLYLLQARPITALPRRPEIEVPASGFWMKDTSHFPSPVTPFGASVYLPAMENGIRLMGREFGFLMEAMENRAIGHEVYVHFVPLGGKEGGPALPAFVIWLGARLLPPFRQRRQIAQEVFRSNLPERTIKRWYSEWRSQFKQEGRDLLNQDLAKLDDVALVNHLDRVIDFMNRGQIVHMRLHGPYLFALYELTVACKELLGWDEARAMSLLSGTSTLSSEPARRLAELAGTINESPVAQKIVTEHSSDVVSRLRQAAPDIAQAFESFMNQYGHRPINYEPGSPTLAERPGFLANLLRDKVTASSSATGADLARARKEAIESARSELSRRQNQDLARFERVLAFAELAYPRREDDIFYTDNVPCALARYAVLEMGRRLVARGVLASAEDAVYLEKDELSAALHGKQNDFSSRVNQRKAERVWVSAHPGPASYGKDPGPPPDPGLLPEPLRFMTRALVWMTGLEMHPSRGIADSGISGVAGSPGRYTGKVCVVHSEAEFSRLRLGDVLVCPITTPAWSILFAQAGAVITDGGGVLSHAAIIAREHGIPAVLGTGDATKRLRDGQTVTVDGTAGIVEVEVK